MKAFPFSFSLSYNLKFKYFFLERNVIKYFNKYATDFMVNSIPLLFSIYPFKFMLSYAYDLFLFQPSDISHDS